MQPINISDYKGDFFKVLANSKDSQVAVMTLKPGQDSGPEDLHPGDQIIYVLEGQAEIEVAGERQKVGQGNVFVIPPKTQHHIYNESSQDLFILNVYAPPAY